MARGTLKPGKLEPMVQVKAPLDRTEYLCASQVSFWRQWNMQSPCSHERWLGSVIKIRDAGTLSITMTAFNKAISTINLGAWADSSGL